MNNSIVISVSLIAVTFVVLYVSSGTNILSTYYKYSSRPNFNCTYSLEGITWNEICLSNHTRGFWYCNGNNWIWKEQTAPFGYECVGGHFKELPSEPALKVASFSINKYTYSICDNAEVKLLLYNMGTATANDKLCIFALNYNNIDSIYSENLSNCYEISIEGGGGSKYYDYYVKIKNDTQIVGYAIYEDNKLYYSNYYEVQVKGKPKVYIEWKPDYVSYLPGKDIDINYKIDVYNGPVNVNIHACIIPIEWKSSNIINDFSYYNDICDNYNGELNSGEHNIKLTVEVPKYGIFDHKYALGSVWYGYGNYYIIGTTYKYNGVTHKDWINKFTIVNSTNYIENGNWVNNESVGNNYLLYGVVISIIIFLFYKIVFNRWFENGH